MVPYLSAGPSTAQILWPILAALGQSQEPKSSFPDPIVSNSDHRFVASRRPLFLPTLHTICLNITVHVRCMYTELYTALHVKHIDFEGAIIPGSEIVSEMIWIV